MKINMWLIEENLKKYNPKYDITDGTACISGVRFFPERSMWSSFRNMSICICIRML